MPRTNGGRERAKGKHADRGNKGMGAGLFLSLKKANDLGEFRIITFNFRFKATLVLLPV